VVRMSPPLVATGDEVDEAVEALSSAVEKVAAARGWTP
jgi:hypothetical protein